MIFFFSLPIAHVSSIQSISIVLFIILFFYFEYKNVLLKPITSQKSIIYIFLGLLVLSFWSLCYTPNLKESIGEIQSEIIRNFLLLSVLFYFTLYTHNIKNLLIILCCVLFFHTNYNIMTWIIHGGFPFRAGGLLDNGGGERFGIWATYALAISISLCISSYKRIGITFFGLSLLSIIANNTRATYVAVLLIICAFLFIFLKNRKILIMLFSFFCVLVSLFYHYSDNFSNRYNLKNTIKYYEIFLTLSPSKYIELEQNYNIDHSISSRLAMWQSVILYRLQDPITPQGYGRFLYGKSIKQNFDNTPENLPFKIYSQTHNDFIGIFYSLGFIGLLIFLYFLFIPLKISYKLYKSTSNQTYKILSLTIFLGTIGFIGSMLFGSFFGDSEAKFFYCLYGILIGIQYRDSHENNISTSI